MILENEKSKKPRMTVNTNTETITIQAEPTSSWRLDHETFFISDFTSFKNVFTFSIAFIVFFLAGLEGFEPPTGGFGVRCSTN